MLTKWKFLHLILKKSPRLNLKPQISFLRSQKFTDINQFEQQDLKVEAIKAYARGARRSKKRDVVMTSEDLAFLAKELKFQDTPFIQPEVRWTGYKEGITNSLVAKYKGEDQEKEVKVAEISSDKLEVFERDMTVLVIQEYIEQLTREKPISEEGLNILDATCSSGLKSLRILNEVDNKHINRIVTVSDNDSPSEFEEFMKVNCLANRLTPEQAVKWKVRFEDIKQVMFDSQFVFSKHTGKFKYQIIDIDQKGSPIPYISHAVEAMPDNGGLLCVTFSDVNVLSGKDHQKTYYYYGSSTSRSNLSDEQSLRIALHSINTIANKRLKYIKPLLCFFDNKSFRLYLKVSTSKKECSLSVLKTGNVLVCSKCPNHKVVPLGVPAVSWRGHPVYVPTQVPANTEKCEICDSPQYLSKYGPIWIAPINDLEFVKELHQRLNETQNSSKLQSFEKISDLLGGIIREKPVNHVPMPISFFKLAQFFDMDTIPNRNLIIKALQNQGFYATTSYLCKKSWKTNAPAQVIFDLLKFWRSVVMSLPPSSDSFGKDSIQCQILSKKIKYLPKFPENIDLKEDIEDARSFKEYEIPLKEVERDNSKIEDALNNNEAAKMK